jgi:hypothetical protein
MKTLVLVFLLLFVTKTSSCDSEAPIEHPSNTELLGNFQAHKQEFEELARMASDDSKVVRITFGSGI